MWGLLPPTPPSMLLQTNPQSRQSRSFAHPPPLKGAPLRVQACSLSLLLEDVRVWLPPDTHFRSYAFSCGKNAFRIRFQHTTSPRQQLQRHTCYTPLRTLRGWSLAPAPMARCFAPALYSPRACFRLQPRASAICPYRKSRESCAHSRGGIELPRIRGRMAIAVSAIGRALLLLLLVFSCAPWAHGAGLFCRHHLWRHCVRVRPLLRSL